MNLDEYEKVKDLTYLEYCDYLQNKYGIGKDNYFSKNWGKHTKVSRTKEGLMAHHKYEYKAIMLSTVEYAKRHPYKWQLAENIVYCDYLEHLFLHILICEYHPNGSTTERVGIGGVVNFLVPELNDIYSGWQSKQEWKLACCNKIIDDRNVYLILLKRFISKAPLMYRLFGNKALRKSFNEKYGLWNRKNNIEIFKQIKKM